MSYYSRVCCSIGYDEIQYGETPYSEIEPIAKQWIQAQDNSLDLLESVEGSLQTSFFEFVGFNRFYSPDTIDLYRYMSKHFPSAEVLVRGVSKEFDDMWYRHSKDGETFKEMG